MILVRPADTDTRLGTSFFFFFAFCRTNQLTKDFHSHSNGRVGYTMTKLLRPKHSIPTEGKREPPLRSGGNRISLCA